MRGHLWTIPAGVAASGEVSEKVFLIRGLGGAAKAAAPSLMTVGLQNGVFVTVIPGPDQTAPYLSDALALVRQCHTCQTTSYLSDRPTWVKHNQDGWIFSVACVKIQLITKD
jgi:hypothetical protein